MAIGNVTASIEMGSGCLCKLTDESISPDTRTQSLPDITVFSMID